MKSTHIVWAQNISPLYTCQCFNILAVATADATIHPFLPTFKKATKKLEDRVVVLEKNKPLTGRRSGDVLIRRFVLFISISLLDLDNKNYFCFYFHNTKK